MALLGAACDEEMRAGGSGAVGTSARTRVGTERAQSRAAWERLRRRSAKRGRGTRRDSGGI